MEVLYEQRVRCYGRDPDCDAETRTVGPRRVGGRQVLGMAQGGADGATRRETGQTGRKPRDGPSHWVLPGPRKPRVEWLHNFASVLSGC